MKEKKGHTLIEMVMTIALSSVLLVGLFFAVQAQYKVVVDHRNYLVGLNLARRQMAIMLSGAYPAVAAESVQTPDPGFPGFVLTREVTSVDTSGSESLRQVIARTRLGSISGPVLVELRTYRTSLVSFGDGS